MLGIGSSVCGARKMTDLERFERIDELRRTCDQQGTTYGGDSWTKENVAWVFAMALREIHREVVLNALREGQEGWIA